MSTDISNTPSSVTTSCLTMTTQNSLPAGASVGSQNKSYIFNAEIQNIHSLIPVLKSICIKRIAMMVITERGLKISCEEENRTVQATAFIDKNLFVKYEMNKQTPETLCFRMSDLLNALSILFPNTRQHSSHTFGHLNNVSSLLKIKYENVDRLKLQVVKGTYSAMAYIQTFQSQQLIVFSMAFVNKIILDASVMIDFWKCADTASTRLYMKILDAEPWFEMATESDRGRFIQRISAHSVHVEHYECTVPLEERYEMTSMHFTVRPLLLASKVSIRMDSNGLLNMQFVIHLDSDSNITTFPFSVTKPNGNFQNVINQTRIANATPPPSVGLSDVQKCFVEFYVIPCVA